MFKTKLADLALEKCFMNASGVLSSSYEELKVIADAGAGALVTKTLTLSERKGNPEPRLIELEHGYLQSMGLPNPGYRNFEYEKVAGLGLPIIASFAGFTVDEFFVIAKYLQERKEVSMLEVNVSCPNTENRVYCYDKKLEEILKGVRETATKPLTVKLAPILDKQQLIDVVQMIEGLGYECVTAINSLPNALAIDIEKRAYMNVNKFGALSGKYIKPVALGIVRTIYDNTDLNIIGVGGIHTWKDAVEFILAGANAVAVGSALLRFDPKHIFKNIEHGLESYLKQFNYTSISSMRGDLK